MNAADNVHRSGKKMTKIEVEATTTMDGGLRVSVLNDGAGIPVERHSKEKIYVPELIFGHLLTGSNFDDESKRLTGGRHGYGAKLTNIFSKKFSIEILDVARKLLYRQSWEQNMSKSSEPEITKSTAPKSSSDYTRIIFEPDLQKFSLAPAGESNAESRALDSVIRLFHRRTVDVAACVPSVRVTFNGAEVPVKSFKDYVRMFAPPVEVEESVNSTSSTSANTSGTENASSVSNSHPILFYQKVSDRWEVGVTHSRSSTFENMSFVNSLWTPDGGTHVQLVVLQIVKAFEEALAKKGVSGVHTNTIRNRLMVFVKSSIENPSFESQSKLSLSSKPSSFGSQCILPSSFLKQIIDKSGILDEILLDLKFREEAKLMKSVTKSKRTASGSLVDVPKLEDAHFAGDAKKALDCTLILTEGDSAKALAIAGLEAVGRQYYGVMPLRGKILNVRVASTAQLMKNEELVNLCKALGLDFNQSYDGPSLSGTGLRYGKVLLMCDQDHDGSHIKGLVINFFHHFWPALLRQQGFLQQFITPLVKVTGGAKSSSHSSELMSFYSMQEYNAWRRSLSPTSIASDQENELTNESSSTTAGQSTMKKYKIKYYKGLGTNTADEGKEYFRSLDKHLKQFSSSPQDDDSIDLAFSKSRAADRRQWLESYYDAEDFIDPKFKTISYTDFVNKELIQFSFSDNARSIPSVVDGLKPSQRKILYACFKKKLTSDMKVVQLAGYVAEHTAYHHGEVSLHAAIVNMAQDFVGANNVPLLVPSGQFGTRYQGGSDFASPRYIFTRLAPVTRLLFPEADDPHLVHLEEDGVAVEPKRFLPVIPLLLVNGSQGIGTGWSTFVPGYNPLEILDYVRRKVRGDATGYPTLQPWVRGFKGKILLSSNKEHDFESHGLVSVKGRGGKMLLEVRHNDEYFLFQVRQI